MSRLTKLHKNQNHEVAENLPFILRMRLKTSEPPSRVDSINTFKQLRHVYQAMEAKIDKFKDFNQFIFFKNKPWTNRSHCLTADIQQMSKTLHQTEINALMTDDNVLPATQAMVDDINQADEFELLGYLAVRCLGDVFGGQHLNQYNQKTFKDQPLDGLFYNSVKGQIISLSRYINQFDMTEGQESQFYKAANRCFEHHVALFKNMEDLRMPVRNYAVDPESCFSLKQAACYTLFGLSAVSVIGLSVYTKTKQA